MDLGNIFNNLIESYYYVHIYHYEHVPKIINLGNKIKFDVAAYVLSEIPNYSKFIKFSTDPSLPPDILIPSGVVEKILGFYPVFKDTFFDKIESEKLIAGSAPTNPYILKVNTEKLIIDGVELYAPVIKGKWKLYNKKTNDLIDKYYDSQKEEGTFYDFSKKDVKEIAIYESAVFELVKDYRRDNTTLARNNMEEWKKTNWSELGEEAIVMLGKNVHTDATASVMEVVRDGDIKRANNIAEQELEKANTNAINMLDIAWKMLNPTNISGWTNKEEKIKYMDSLETKEEFQLLEEIREQSTNFDERQTLMENTDLVNALNNVKGALEKRQNVKLALAVCANLNLYKFMELWTKVFNELKGGKKFKKRKSKRRKSRKRRRTKKVLNPKRGKKSRKSRSTKRR